tara:strand:- start:492 stop:1280 length:789 start_codon:yes stop_codon:yes gene_type:complete
VSHSTISLGLGLGGGKSATSSGAPGGGGGFPNVYSVDFDGVDDYMALDTGSINLYGLSMWFKCDSAISASSGVKGVLLGQSGTSYFLALGGNITGDFSNELITIRASGQNSFAYTDASATISTDWHHIVGAWSTSAATTGGNGYDIYLDGNKVGNAAGSSTPSSPYTIGSSAFRIGQRQNAAYPFAGLIDEVSIFTSTLSASNIATLYNSGTPGDISSLSPFGWWRMGDNNGGEGTAITDLGSGGNNGTLTNGPAFSEDVPS